jgi:hypothetical protein
MQELLRPARRASWMMIILAILLGLAGTCCLGFGTLTPWGRLPPESLTQMHELEAQSGVSMKTLFIMSSVVALVPALLLGVIGYFVRRGSITAIVMGILLDGLILLLLMIVLLNALAAAAGGKPLDAATGLLMFSIFFVAFGLLLVWLIQAARTSGRLGEAKLAQQARNWQAYQQQQAYQQYPPPPPQDMPPPPGPPPAP